MSETCLSCGRGQMVTSRAPGWVICTACRCSYRDENANHDEPVQRGTREKNMNEQLMDLLEDLLADIDAGDSDLDEDGQAKVMAIAKTIGDNEDVSEEDIAFIQTLLDSKSTDEESGDADDAEEPAANTDTTEEDTSETEDEESEEDAEDVEVTPGVYDDGAPSTAEAHAMLLAAVDGAEFYIQFADAPAARTEAYRFWRLRKTAGLNDKVKVSFKQPKKSNDVETPHCYVGPKS